MLPFLFSNKSIKNRPILTIIVLWYSREFCNHASVMFPKAGMVHSVIIVNAWCAGKTEIP